MTNPPAADEPAANAAAERSGAGDESPTKNADISQDSGTTAELPAKAETSEQSESDRDDTPRFEADYATGTASTDDLSNWPADEPEAPKTADEPEAPKAAEAPPTDQPPPPGGTPPPGAMPPPYGNQPPFGNPPPFRAAFNRNMLVRPQQGRYVAGVCAAIGRATNTDPTLWRVIFAVLTLAGGVSIVAYLLGWLLLPAEGDTGSPLEALLGRGRSTTSAPLAIVIGVGAVLAFLLVMSQNFGAAVVGLLVVVGVVALVVRGQGNQQQQQPPAGPYVPPAVPNPPQAGPYATTGAPYGAAPFEAQQTAPRAFGPPSFGSPSFGSPSFGIPAASGTIAENAPAEATSAQAFPVAPAEPKVAPIPPAAPIPAFPPLPPMPPMPGAGPGYRPPFAPHGPYVSNSPYAASLGVPPGVPITPYPGLAPMSPKPKPPKERSKLGRITLSLIVISLGILAALEVTVADFKASTWFAVPLAITALGLITGAWLGRARVLILLGALLSIALAIATAASTPVPHRTDNINIMPTSVSSLAPRYDTDFGNINADLTQIDFVDQEVSVAFRAGAGNMEITVPEKVDVTVNVHIQGGDCQVFGNDCSGFRQTSSYTDYGTDGPGGGKLHLDLDLQWGNVKVTR